MLQLLDGEAFKGLVCLSKLRMRYETHAFGHGRVLKQGSFAHLINIESIDLTGCFIERIESGSFRSLSKLKKLDLSSNMLTAFPFLRELNNLETLKLKNNRIVSIDQLFERRSNQTQAILKYLNLSQNKLTCLEDNSFSFLPSLEALHLNSNQIDSISLGAFNGLCNLRVLCLSFNESHSIESIFYNPDLANLRVIKLNNRYLSVNESFDSTTNEELTLFRQQIIVEISSWRSFVKDFVFSRLRDPNRKGLVYFDIHL
jgi:Leucine-rich repeat (LRR) protein